MQFETGQTRPGRQQNPLSLERGAERLGGGGCDAPKHRLRVGMSAPFTTRAQSAELHNVFAELMRIFGNVRCEGVRGQLQPKRYSMTES